MMAGSSNLVRYVSGKSRSVKPLADKTRSREYHSEARDDDRIATAFIVGSSDP
jgi:hypothetical protein